MNSARNSFVHFSNRKNVGGNVDAPPAPRLRSAHLSAYPAARVERTGRLRRRASRQAGLAGWGIKNGSICHRERCR